LKKPFLTILPGLLFFCLSLNGQIISTFAGTGSPGYSGDSGLAISAELSFTKGVAYDKSGNIYISDTQNNVIRKVNSSGIISTIAGTGVAGYSGDGGQALSAQLNRPYGIVVDSTGNVYFSDTYNSVVRRISTTGIINTVAGNGTSGYSGDGMNGTLAQLYRPYGLAIDNTGSLYIADCFNSVIRKLNSTGVISTVAGTGSASYSGDGGLATIATLNSPTAVAFDSHGNLFIADYSNNRIRKVNTSNIISTVAGDGTVIFSGDNGPALNASIALPTGIGVDAADNIYICDHNHARIRLVDTTGMIMTIAGNGSFTDSGDGGPATSGSMNGPEEIAVMPSGVVYVAESNGNRIRKITPSSLTATPHSEHLNFRFYLYPNPTNGIVTTETRDTGSIEMFNCMGQRVYSKELLPGKNTIDLSALPTGIYVVRNMIKIDILYSTVIKE
jgi:trimeric autotransporter adhesin